MSQTLDSGGITVDVHPDKNQTPPLENTETSDTSADEQNKLQKFLKGNLRALGVAQIMIGIKCMLYGAVGLFGINSLEYRDTFFSFSFISFFPVCAAVFFIISGSLTVVSAKKQTKSLLRSNIGANTVSTLVSVAGICLLSYNIFKVSRTDCDEDICFHVKTIATGLVIILMMLVCLQILISFPLSMLTYKVDGKNIGWSSVLFCWKSASEGPYQDLLPQTSVYRELEHKGTTPPCDSPDTSKRT